MSIEVEVIAHNLALHMIKIDPSKGTDDDQPPDGDSYNELWAAIVHVFGVDHPGLLEAELEAARKEQKARRLAREARWSPRDQREALAQGWGVFANSDHGMRIERRDEDRRFVNDAAAWAWVAGRQAQDHLCAK